MKGGDERRAKALGSRVLHRGATLKIGLEEIELPNGKRLELEVIRHPGAAAIVPFVDDDHIVLLRQYRHAAGGWLWEVPAGKLEAGEEPVSCAERELREETGYTAGRIERTGAILTTPGFTNERIHLFSAFELAAGPESHEDYEVIETHQVRFEDALAMVDRGEIEDGKTIAALFHAARRRSRLGADVLA